MEATSKATVDELAEDYIRKQTAFVEAETELKALRQIIIGRVREEGSYPPRATKMRVLAGNEFELRVTEPTEVSVDTKIALHMQKSCYSRGVGPLFHQLLRKVEMFVLAGGAEKVIREKLPEGAPRNLRSLFARAIQIKHLPPQVEAKRRKQAEAA